MNKKKLLFLPLLALALLSCSSDTDGNGISSWLSYQGMPNSYKVQTVTVEGLKPTSADVYVDTLPNSATNRAVLGASSGLSHDLLFDILLDSASLAKMNSADSGAAGLLLYLAKDFYESRYLPSDMLPIEEELKLKLSWILSDKLTGAELNSIQKEKDSVWFNDLKTWKAQKSADTTYSISVSLGKKDTLAKALVAIDMPRAFVKDIQKNSGNRRLQLRVSAPEASHVYRFAGKGDDTYYPTLRLVAFDSDTSFKYTSYFMQRAATIASNHETCSDCLVLHCGVNDSLIVEFPSKPIMKALSDFYGDEFPYTEGDSNDVRQAVVMAVLTFAKDDSKGNSELGLPIKVVPTTYKDSADMVVRQTESYVLNDGLVSESGHPNLVFHGGDSLSLQVTKGMRDFINRAGDGRSFKMMMRLGATVFLDKDSLLYDRQISYKDTLLLANGEKKILAAGDTVVPVLYYPDFDFARYDFASIKNKPAKLKLWLASKRGEE